jgi:D-glycero-D-manno-heptose 1,7-bisphosphate phosphatase
MNKCIFLDRDGVLNKDKVDYVYDLKDHFILDGVTEALRKLKEAGYLLIIITNQSGIAKGIYERKHVIDCYQELQKECGNVIDDIYFSPYHPSYDSECLSRKPGSLMFEKAIAKYNIDKSVSWMAGDKERDLVPAKKLGIKTIYIPEHLSDADNVSADIKAGSLFEACNILLARY